MAILRATAILNMKSGEPKDAARNVWHFATAGAVTEAEMASIGAHLGTFYQALSGRLNHHVSRAANVHKVQFAQVTQGGPGADDDTVSELLSEWAFGTTTSPGVAGPAPTELACALSFHGDLTGVPEEANGGLTRPRSRRRGRVMIGPLNAGTLALQGTIEVPEFSSTFRGELVTAYESMITSINAAVGDPKHIVYSRSEPSAFVVVGAWADAATDTVRRRGVAASGRTESDPIIQV